MKRKLLTAIAAIVLIASCSQPSADVPRNVNIIAVGLNYDWIIIDGTAQLMLSSPESDARNASDQLAYLAKEAGYTCTSRLYFGNSGQLEEQNTGKSINTAEFMAIFDGIEASSQDLTIFYFSGHGTLDKAGRSSLVIDYDAARAAPTARTVQEIAGELEAIGGKSLILIDACNSGSESPGSVGSGEVFDAEYIFGTETEILIGTDAGTAISDAFQASFCTAREYGSVYIIAACTPPQVSWDGGASIGNSFFTEALLQVLGYDTDADAVGTPRDNEITLCGLYQGIYNALHRYDFEGYPLSSVQTPQPSRLPSDFVIFRF